MHGLPPIALVLSWKTVSSDYLTPNEQVPVSPSSSGATPLVPFILAEVEQPWKRKGLVHGSHSGNGWSLTCCAMNSHFGTSSLSLPSRLALQRREAEMRGVPGLWFGHVNVLQKGCLGPSAKMNPTKFVVPMGLVHAASEEELISVVWPAFPTPEVSPVF